MLNLFITLLIDSFFIDELMFLLEAISYSANFSCYAINTIEVQTVEALPSQTKNLASMPRNTPGRIMYNISVQILTPNSVVMQALLLEILPLSFLLGVLGQAKEDVNTRALIYLIKYGYIVPRKGSSALMNEEGLEIQIQSAIRDFQAFAGLNQTGFIDEETKELMNTPRCGVKDLVGPGALMKRRKRYCENKTPQKSDGIFNIFFSQVCLARQQMDSKKLELSRNQIPKY